MVSGTSLGARMIRLTLTVCLIADWCGPLDRGQSFRAHAAGPVENAPTPEKLDRLFTALKTAQKQIRRVNFDPQAVVDTIGKDPGRLFEWVRDNTFWVRTKAPSRARSVVLADRMGNSLDRSLLLAELLRTAGFQTRLANAQAAAAAGGIAAGADQTAGPDTAGCPARFGIAHRRDAEARRGTATGSGGVPRGRAAGRRRRRAESKGDPRADR